MFIRSGTRIPDSDILLFFDEIQECPKAISNHGVGFLRRRHAACSCGCHRYYNPIRWIFVANIKLNYPNTKRLLIAPSQKK